MHLADDPKTDAISAGINLRHVGTKRIMSRLDVQILTGIGQSSAIKLMKSTHHCFSIATSTSSWKRTCSTTSTSWQRGRASNAAPERQSPRLRA